MLVCEGLKEWYGVIKIFWTLHAQCVHKKIYCIKTCINLAWFVAKSARVGVSDSTKLDVADIVIILNQNNLENANKKSLKTKKTFLQKKPLDRYLTD